MIKGGSLKTLDSQASKTLLNFPENSFKQKQPIEISSLLY